ncbi:MAG TPA: hypothetical protein VHC50_03460 [Puia sp.]|nr:hypothetical protein [Puia sp.]
MKHTLLFLASLPLSIFAFAQSNPFGKEDHIKITVAKKDSLCISFKGKSFPLDSIHDLDSCLKKNISEMTLPEVDLETFTDMTPEDHRAIIVIMDKYRLPVVSERTLSSGNGKIKTSMRGAAYNP